MSITKITTPELLDFPKDSTSSANTSGTVIPTGNAAAEPSSNLNAGEFRFNTTTGYVEYYDGSTWQQIADEYITGQPSTCICNYPTTATSLYQLQGPTVTDTCGNYPGTIFGGVGFTSGKFGNALNLTTSSTYVELQTFPDSWCQNPCSLSVWVNMRTLTAGWSNGSYIFSADGDWRLQFTNDASYGITFGKWNSTYGNNGNNELKSAVPSVDTWYHVVVTDNQANDATGNLKLYINGVLTDSQIGYAGSRTFAASDYASIGASGEGRTGIDGQIDQLRLFPSVLTATQVTELYNEVICN